VKRRRVRRSREVISIVERCGTVSLSPRCDFRSSLDATAAFHFVSSSLADGPPMAFRPRRSSWRTVACLPSQWRRSRGNQCDKRAAFQLSKRAPESCVDIGTYITPLWQQQTKGNRWHTRGRFRLKPRRDGCDGLLTEASLTSGGRIRDWGLCSLARARARAMTKASVSL